MRALVGEKLKMEKVCWSMSLLVMFILILAEANVVLPTSDPQASDPPAYVYLTWARDDTAHSINISWRTDENYIGEVHYDAESQGGAPEAYSYSAEGTRGVTTSEFDGYIHHVELTDLEPDTKYYFICGNPDNGWSEELSFRTAPVDSKNVSFAVGGDSRSNNFFHPTNPDWPGARDTITQVAASCSPNFINFNGDFISSGEEQRGEDTWDNWLGAWYKYARAEDGSLITMVPIIGNHELAYPQPSDYNPEEDASNYYMVFNLPGNERWYSLDWGPDLHLIILDSELLSSTSLSWAEQLDWLEWDLEEHRDCLWKIVSFHRPVYSSGHYAPGELSRLEDWVSLFDMYKVDIVFSSHDHGYERTGPIDHTSHPGELMDSPENGRIYVVTAGWGAELYYGENSWFTAPDSPGRIGAAENAYHCCIVNIFENGTLDMKAIDTNGETFDEYSIHKEVSALGEVPIVAIAVSAVVIACAAVAFYLLKIRR